jgi:nucleoside-diphosphate-sugar epimerase
MVKLIVGCGYLGGRVAQKWLADGHSVVAVTRSPERAEQLERDGLRPIVADVTKPNTLAGLPTAETVLYAVGYDRRSGASRWDVYVGGLGAVLDALPVDTGRFLLTSSTGVYGQSDDSWVDEESPCRPVREGGRVMLAAEEVLGKHLLSSRAIILRLAGLYGPDRIPRMDDLLTGRPIAAPARGRLNLIHVDDAVAAVLAAEAKARPPRTYVISDGHPTQRRQFYEYLARLLDRPAPQFVEPPPDAPSALRAAASKRAGNSRMRNELGIVLAHPSYREGLAAILAAAGQSSADRRAHDL